MTTMYLLALRTPHRDAHSVHPTEQAAGLALAADMLAYGGGEYTYAAVTPIEIETGTTDLVAQVREALGIGHAAGFSFDDCLVEIRRLLDITRGVDSGRYVRRDQLAGIAREQGDALRGALGAAEHAPYSTLIAKVETLVDTAKQTATTFEIPEQPAGVTTVWSWNQQTGDRIRWHLETVPHDNRGKVWTNRNRRGSLDALCTWRELVVEHGPLTAIDPT